MNGNLRPIACSLFSVMSKIRMFSNDRLEVLISMDYTQQEHKKTLIQLSDKQKVPHSNVVSDYINVSNQYILPGYNILL